MADHYQTLGVDRNATQDEIKKAYRKLAAQHHPDRGGDTAKFQEISAAYDTLGDPDKRAQYDNPAPQFGGPGGFHFEGGMPPGFEDIFSAFANGGHNPFGNMFGQRHAPQRNKTLNIRATISLEDAFFGKDLTAAVNLPSGREQVVEIKIPKGVQDGTTLRLAGMGDDSFPNMPRGDIHLTLHIQPHAIFQRQGDDLVRSLDIDAVDAMLGKSVQFNTIDGKTLDMQIKPGTQPGQIMAAAGYGMPNMKDSRFVGRMLIQVNIKVPTNLTQEQINKLKEAFSK